MRERKRASKLLEDYKNKLELPELDRVLPHEIQRSLNCIHEHLFDPKLSVQGLKEKCLINGNSFSGKFKYYVGLSPQQYIVKHRLAAACRLLEKLPVHYPLLHIALAVGYRSHAAFSRTFKRRMGQTPTKYRKCYIK